MLAGAAKFAGAPAAANATSASRAPAYAKIAQGCLSRSLDARPQPADDHLPSPPSSLRLPQPRWGRLAIRRVHFDVCHKGHMRRQPEAPPRRACAGMPECESARNHTVNPRRCASAGQARGPCLCEHISPTARRQGASTPLSARLRLRSPTIGVGISTSDLNHAPAARTKCAFTSVAARLPSAPVHLHDA